MTTACSPLLFLTTATLLFSGWTIRNIRVLLPNNLSVKHKKSHKQTKTFYLGHLWSRLIS